MKEEKRHFSLIKIIKSDYVSSSSLFYPIIFWIAFFSIELNFPKTRGITILLSPLLIFLTVLSGIIFYFRINSFRKLFLSAISVTGTVTDLFYSLRSLKIRYKYSYNNTEYQVWTYCIPRNFKKGEKVTLLIDPDNPKKTCIRELFI